MPNPHADIFILSAFDRDLWCSVLEARFRVDHLDVLRTILGECIADDPDIRQDYLLDEKETAALASRFAADFQPAKLACANTDIFLSRENGGRWAPYLIHTGFELPLLLEGRKKLARMSHGYPPLRFDGEDRFDHWVSAGLLKKFEVTKSVDRSAYDRSAWRTAYYTPLGEEWRVPAMQMLSEVASASGGWNEHFERLEGTLFGYSAAESDWWIAELRRQRGGFGGIGLCFAVPQKDLAWIEAVGFRALPPYRESLDVMVYRADAPEELDRLFAGAPENVAIILFCVHAREASETAGFSATRSWRVSGQEIVRLNKHLRGVLEVIARKSATTSVG